MKIFLITAQYPPIKSEISSFILNLSLHFKWKSHVDPYVITSKIPDMPSAQVADDGVYIFRIMESWGIGEINKIFKLIKKEQPDAVHIQFNDDFPKSRMINLLPFLIKKYKRTIEVVTSIYGLNGDRDTIFKSMLKLVSDSDWIIVNNDNDEQYVVSQFPEAVEKIKKIYSRPNVVYKSETKVNKEEVHKRLKVGEDGILVAYYGRIDKKQGLENLLRAVRFVLDAGKKIKLLVMDLPENEVEVTEKSKYQDDLHKLSEALEIKSNIFWAGSCSKHDIAMSLMTADLAVLPFCEGASGKYSNLWAVLDHGIPLISTHSQEQILPDGLVNGENIILVPAEEVDELANAILSYYDNKNFFIKLGDNGKKLVQDRYSWENLIRQLVNIYKS